MHEKLRERLLRGLARGVSARPWIVIGAGVLLAAVSVGIAGARLEFQANRNALLSDEIPWNKRFRAWRASFPGLNDLFLVVDPGPSAAEAERQKARRLADELGARIRGLAHVERVLWRFEPKPRMVTLAPMERFRSAVGRFRAAEPLLASATPSELLERIAGRMGEARGSDAGADPGRQAERIEALTRLVEAFGAVLERPSASDRAFRELSAALGAGREKRYLRSENGRLFFLRITPRPEPEAMAAYAPAVREIRGVMRSVSAGHPGLETGLTGVKALETDETAAAMRDSTLASVVAAVAIMLLLMAAFRSARAPLIAVGALACAIAWTFGFLTLAVGHLQVISVVFAVILLGLGVAFAIHLLSGLELVRRAHADDVEGFAGALADALARVGPGMATGALTTAAAFMTTQLTAFRGVAEMGLIAGAGVVLCLIAMVTVFPAGLRLLKPAHRHVARTGEGLVPVFSAGWVAPAAHRPRTALGVAVGLVVLSLAGAAQMRFDYNLTRLQPADAESVRWQKRIGRAGGESLFFAVSIAEDAATARQLARRFRELETVGRVGGAGLLEPPRLAEKRALLAEARQALGDALDEARAGRVPETADGRLVEHLTVLRATLGLARARSLPEPVAQSLGELDRAIRGTVARATALEAKPRGERLAELRRAFARWRAEMAKRLAAALDPAPLTVADLPKPLAQAARARTGPLEGRYAVNVYPELPEGVESALAPRFLPRFARQVEKIDPRATGPALQLYRSGQLMKSSYQWAGVYALLIVLGLVWLDFRSLYDAVLSLVPVAAGFSLTFGLMWLVGMRVNPANIIVLPLMFGIGVDAGVHVLHRYRQDGVTRPLGLTGGTGKGVTLTSLVTMLGFGTLMLGSHRGIASLGFVLTVGIALTLLACWFLLPAWLELRRPRFSEETRARYDFSAEKSGAENQ